MNSHSMRLRLGTASNLAATVLGRYGQTGRTDFQHHATGGVPEWLRGIQREHVAPKPVRRQKAPVLVMPGFLGNDLTTAPLRVALRSAGHNALPWQSGLNLGPREGLIRRLTERVSSIVEASGREVILVGHSLGGLYAREVARITPQRVRMVITLGSPIRALEPGNTFANRDIVRMIERTSGRTVADLQNEGLFCDPAAPLPVPCVAIYSKRDRIAPWQTCLQTPARLADVEVDTTHLCMVVSASVYHVILDRISKAEAAQRSSPRSSTVSATGAGVLQPLSL
jgi:pimeloyl-ACP methyl ester carboxylesterase